MLASGSCSKPSTCTRDFQDQGSIMTKQRVSIVLSITVLVGVIRAEEKLDQWADPLPPDAVARLGTIRFRDEQAMIFAAMSPDNKCIATTSGHTLVLWETATGRPIQVGKPTKPWIDANGRD